MSIEADTEIAAPTLVGSQHAASQTWLNKTANGSMRNEPPELRVRQNSLPMPQALERPWVDTIPADSAQLP